MDTAGLSIAQDELPAHVAVVMDGNGRWAQRQGYSRLEGHRRGVDNVRSMVENCIQLGIPYLTLFAFSSENWRRPKQEVAWLMRLLDRALEREVQELHSNGVRLRFIGDISALAAGIQNKIDQACDFTRDNATLHLTVAVNYGGQWDLTQAFRKILLASQKKRNPFRRCFTRVNRPAFEHCRPSESGSVHSYRWRAANEQFSAMAARLHRAVFH